MPTAQKPRKLPGPKAFTDYIAAQRVAELRESRGFSQEALAKAIQNYADEHGWLKPGGLGAVSGDTIASIEQDGHCPSERVRLVLSLFFGVPIRSVWEPQNKRAKTS